MNDFCPEDLPLYELSHARSPSLASITAFLTLWTIINSFSMLLSSNLIKNLHIRQSLCNRPGYGQDLMQKTKIDAQHLYFKQRTR